MFKDFLKRYWFGFLTVLLFGASVFILVQDVQEDQKQKADIVALEKQISELELENEGLADILIPNASLFDVMIGIYNKEQVDSTSLYISKYGITYRVDFDDDVLFNYMSEVKYDFVDFVEMQPVIEELIQELDS